MGEALIKNFSGFNNYKDELSLNNLINYFFDHPEENNVQGINVSNNPHYALVQMKSIKIPNSTIYHINH